MSNVFQIVPIELERNSSLCLLKEMLEVQGADGNWNYDSYMLGMYNGMEFALSIMEGREPFYRCAPEKWLKDLNPDGPPIAIESISHLI